MRFEGAVIRQQGITFAVVVVKKHVIDHRAQAEGTLTAFQPVFPGIPIVLMAQDSRGVPTCFGRDDIARFMANAPLSSVPWKQYTLN